MNRRIALLAAGLVSVGALQFVAVQPAAADVSVRHFVRQALGMNPHPYSYYPSSGYYTYSDPYLNPYVNPYAVPRVNTFSSVIPNYYGSNVYYTRPRSTVHQIIDSIMPF